MQPIRVHSIKLGDTIYTTPDEISNRLNHHFCSVGSILANEIPLADSKFTDYVLPLPHVFSLTKTSNDIVLKLIESLPLNKVSGLDGISAKLLKEAGPIVSASLTYIINRSLTTDIFPNDWKVARVAPIYKDDIKTNPNNFIIKFPYDTHSDWLKQRTLSEYKGQVNDIKLAFKFLLRNFDKFDLN